MSKLGYQIPNFTYPDTANDQIFGKVIDQAKAAEDAGFDHGFVMAHLPVNGHKLERIGMVGELAGAIVN